jgi:ABC-2 type transport system ATP-binding protein
MNSNAIEIRGLVKNYPKFKLGPLDLCVPRGAIYGLIGPNGAGKTTIIDLIFGMGRNDAGEIHVLGFDHRRDQIELKRQTAYASPELNFQVWKKVGNAVRFERGFYPEWDDAYCASLMRAFHLSSDDKIATLSFGAKTKLSLLLTLSRRPKVLVLDEPTTGLDAVSKQEIFSELLKTVENGERTVMISSHSLGDIERFADHIGMIKSGKVLLEGPIDEIVDRFRLAEFFSTNRTNFQNRAGLMILRRNENRWHALLDLKSDVESWLQNHDANQITLTRVTLEDLFVALAKDGEVV